MIHRDDLLKLLGAVAALGGAIAAHSLKLPPAWEPAMPYVEFLSGCTAVVLAFFMKSSATK